MYSTLKSNAINALIAVRAEKNALVVESNALAKEALALIAKIQNNIEKQSALSDIMLEVDTYVVLNKADMERTLENIKDALKNLNEGEIPEMDDISDFEGYCENCGEILTTDDCEEYEGEMLCSACVEARENEYAETEVDEAEDTEEVADNEVTA